MRAGRLRHKIIIKASNNTQDEYGADDGTYTNILNIRANVAVLSGSELLKAGVVLSTNVLSVLVRYNAKIEDDMYLEWENVTYRIDLIKPGSRRRDMVITASVESNE